MSLGKRFPTLAALRSGGQIVGLQIEVRDRGSSEGAEGFGEAFVGFFFLARRNVERRAHRHPDRNARRSREPTARGIETIAPEDKAWDDRNGRQAREHGRAALRRDAAENRGRSRANSALGKYPHQPSGGEPLESDTEGTTIGSHTVDRKGVERAQPGADQRVGIKFFGRHPIDRPLDKGEQESGVEMRDVIGHYDRGAGRLGRAGSVPDVKPDQWSRDDSAQAARKTIAPLLHGLLIARGAAA